MRPEDFGPFTLSEGSHESPSDGMCVMEMVSFLAGEEWSDMPSCASPVISLYCQVINDRIGQDVRDRLQTYVPRLIGTASPEHDQARAGYLAWQAVTVFAPMALDASGFNAKADLLRKLDKTKGFAAAYKAAYAAADAAADVSTAATGHATADRHGRWRRWQKQRAAACAAACAAAHAASDAAADAAYRAAHSAAHSARAAARAAGPAAVDAAFDALDGALAIGPSGSSYTAEQVARIEPLRELVKT